MTSPTNETRIAWADAALRYYRDMAASTDDDKLADLLSDLMHWADANGMDFPRALSRAEMNHHFETGGRP